MAFYRNRVNLITLIIIFLLMVLKVDCYEKTLRKMVRDQSKMVHRRFSDGENTKVLWSNTLNYPLHVQTSHLLFHSSGESKATRKVQRSKIIALTGSEPARIITCHDYVVPNKTSDFGLGRKTIRIKVSTEANYMKKDYNMAPKDLSVVPVLPHSNYFPAIQGEPSTHKGRTVLPDSPINDNNTNILSKFSNYLQSTSNMNVVSKQSISSKRFKSKETHKVPNQGCEHENPNDGRSSRYTNVSRSDFCTHLIESKAEIKTEEKFDGFNDEPQWMSVKKYWNKFFDNRYENLMRNTNWPPLKVILVPRSHVDSIWKKTFMGYHNDIVNKILSNVVKKLQFYKNLTFTWNEVSHLSQWWKTSASFKSRMALRRLTKYGRLEITTGGWVETDGATVHLFGLVHQLTEGHQWLKTYLNFSPKVAWITHSVTHSPTIPYLLSAAGISKLVITNLHYSWEEYLAESQFSDFLWLQNWDVDRSSVDQNRTENQHLPKSSVLTHFIQFNSDGFKACGPSNEVCKDFDFRKQNRNVNIYSFNIKERAEMLLEQYSKSGTISPHNVIIAPIGGSYHYEQLADIDYQYNNYQRLADFVNMNSKIYRATIEFGTPKDYFRTVLQMNKTFPTLRGDFAIFADVNNGKPAYWTGFFTSRPLLKILLRRLQSTLRSTEILVSFAISLNIYKKIDSDIFGMLFNARESLARLLDRNVVSGTIPSAVLKYVYSEIHTTIKNCWYIQEVTVSFISMKPNKTEEVQPPYLQKYVYRDGEYLSAFRSVSAGDQIYIFNSLSHERTEIIEIMVRYSNIRIVDHNGKELTMQLNPVWIYKSNNVFQISKKYFKVLFIAVVPALTLQMYKIKYTFNNYQYAANILCDFCDLNGPSNSNTLIPFTIQPTKSGDILLENFIYQLVIDQNTGFLIRVVEKKTGIQKNIALDYLALENSKTNSGVFIFETNATKKVQDLLAPYRIGNLTKICMVISGKITNEVITVYGRLLVHSVKIFNLNQGPLSKAIYVESKVDHSVSPKSHEQELFLSIETEIANGNPSVLYTDNNGFQYSRRLINYTRRIEANMYPITSMAFMQDQRTRLTVITDHAQAVTALREGHMALTLDRRVLRVQGYNEDLYENSFTYHRNYILLENFSSPTFSETNPHSLATVELPSITAVHLANTQNDFVDIFLIDKNQTKHCDFMSLPLIKSSFSCDVNLINFRTLFNNQKRAVKVPNTALMILHRPSFTCKIEAFCYKIYKSFKIENILHNVKSVFHTNLCGTNKGKTFGFIDNNTLPPMALITLRIQF